MNTKKSAFLPMLLFLALTSLDACTIFSGKDSKGRIWAGNSEDMFFTFNSYLNIVAATDSTFGYICFLISFGMGFNICKIQLIS